MEKNNRPNYANWVPMRLLFLLAFLVVVATALFVVAFCCSHSLLLKTLSAALLLATVCLLFMMSLSHRAFSPSGGNLMDKIHQYLVDRLMWDGNGQLLDVGCGAGALTIRCARKFPEANCVGIDYWGVGWDYSKKMCERNAKIEGVDARCNFLKGDASAIDFPDETFDAVVSNFVYHEVRSKKTKEELIRESLRVLKKGGAFALQDLFGQRSVYGNIHAIVERLEEEGISEIYYAESGKELSLPAWLRLPGMLKGVGIIYGRK